jgi:hypothetical protein
LAVGLLATALRLDRDRAFYPTVTIVIASYYVLFAVAGASTQTLVLESMAGVGFLLAAAFGFRSSLWVVVVALAAHGIFDLVHGAAITNPGVPSWWPDESVLQPKYAFKWTAGESLSVPASLGGGHLARRYARSVERLEMVTSGCRSTQAVDQPGCRSTLTEYQL